ncbi:hypothetical protein HY639_04190 [Candidatus Woesearchaeota archaeon]|nr:hypothetical protein [Candidatus Woesearchaeota archaeon]
MSSSKFHKTLYPKEILLACIEMYAAFLHTVTDEDGDYIVLTYPDTEKKVAREFINYVLAEVRSHASH